MRLPGTARNRFVIHLSAAGGKAGKDQPVLLFLRVILGVERRCLRACPAVALGRTFTIGTRAPDPPGVESGGCDAT